MYEVDSEQVLQLEKLLGKARKIAVVVHTHPDGDAIGSAVASVSYINGVLHGDACAILPDPAPGSLGFISEGEPVLVWDDDRARERLACADLILCQDFNTFDRTAAMEDSLKGSSAVKVLVDHHLQPRTECFSLVFSFVEASSTCELLYGILLKTTPVHGDATLLPARCAYALMAGMTTDTNNFANSVTPATLRMAAGLLEAGVDRDDILSHLYERYPERRFRLMGKLVGDIMHITPEGASYMIADTALLEKAGVEDGDMEGFVNIPLGIDRVKMSLFLRQEEGQFRVSIRSKGDISANTMARKYFHGGGHERAAGGKLYIPEDIPSAGDAAGFIENAVREFLK